MHHVVPVHNWRKGSQWGVLTRKHAEIIFPTTSSDGRTKDIRDGRAERMPLQLGCCKYYLYNFPTAHVPSATSDDGRTEDIKMAALRQSASATFPLHMFPPQLQMTILKDSCHVQPDDASKEHNCIPDEHYVQTLLVSLSFKIQQEGLEEEITRRTLTHTSWVLSSFKDRERRGWHPMTYKLVDATTTLIQSIKGNGAVKYRGEKKLQIVPIPTITTMPMIVSDLYFSCRKCPSLAVLFRQRHPGEVIERHYSSQIGQTLAPSSPF
ncbi:hypothetical protein HYC85_017490 [Camellia sinensis]|uniref:Uncharacterized protein n=1 Tax=Camellia sinensis TaxID=4442 RepID=A0A7J7GRK9_CAMSI|nr:hypothetical protein HYC85_017490 [Camellia sinensis]